MRSVFTIVLQAILTVICGIVGAVLVYAATGFVSLLVWPGLRESNLAGLPAALAGLLFGLSGGGLGGWWLSTRLSKRRPIVLKVACLVALCLFSLMFYIFSLLGN